MKHVLLTLEWSRSRRRFSCAEVARCTNQIVGERCTFVVLDDQPFATEFDLVYLWSLKSCQWTDLLVISYRVRIIKLSHPALVSLSFLFIIVTIFCWRNEGL